MHRHTTVMLVVVTSAAAITGCAAAEPGAREPDDLTRPVRFAAAEGSLEQRALIEIYARVLSFQGRDTEILTRAESDILEDLRVGDIDLAVGCTGGFLEQLDPANAAETAGELKQASDPASASAAAQEVYQRFVGSLPPEITTTDPSAATGCEGQADLGLPQNIVPVLGATVLDRAEFNALNNTTRLITTADIESILENAGDADGVPRAVNAWIEENGVKAAAEPESPHDDTESDAN